MYYDSLDKNCKSITGAVEEGKPVKFTVYGDFEALDFLFKKDGEDFTSLPMKKGDGFFCIEKTFKVGLYFYLFKSGTQFISANEAQKGIYQNHINPFELTSYAPYKTPDWFKSGVMYQIFPDRFKRCGNVSVKKGAYYHENWYDTPVYLPDEKGEILNNDFFGGNFKGIKQKIKYLKKLSVKTIYLNPVFEAYSNHRYDTGDYMKFDSLLGDEKDFTSLVKSAKESGIGIMLDGVFNHTGSDSIYFNKNGTYSSVGAYQSKKSPYYSWYDFEYYPDKYRSWWGIKTLPSIKPNQPDFIRFITGKNGVIEKYGKMGVMGWRLDVVDELSDDFVQKIRKAVKKSDKNAVLIGEVWEDASNKIAYDTRKKYFQGAELDSVMNYPLKNAIINFVNSKKVYPFLCTVRTLIDHYPKQSLDTLMNILGTHDTERILTMLGTHPHTSDKHVLAEYKMSEEDLKAAKKKLKIASLLQYTVFGVPCIYYGDEAGMQGFRDPFNRRAYPYGKEDKELLSWYIKLGRIRSLPVFSDGEFKEVFSDENALIFERRKGEDGVLVCVNMGDREYKINFEGKLFDLLNNKEYEEKAVLKKESVMLLYTENIFKR